jgi:hypothetical protein
MDRKYKILHTLLNRGYSLPHQTNLSTPELFGFANWAQNNNVPLDLSARSDYDMPGFYKEGLESKVSELDNLPHFSDRYKTPSHQSFSKESVYASEDAPHWEGNALRNNKGELEALELPNTPLLKTFLNKYK